MTPNCKLLSESQHVVDAIDAELHYQNNLPISDGNNNGVAGQLVTLERYTRKALDAWTDNAGDLQSLHGLRKCAAIAVRALIEHGCPARA
jgi:hypothetical protein